MLYLSPRAAQLIGVHELRRAAQPVGKPGQRARDRQEPWGADNPEAWWQERRACQALEAHLEPGGHLLESTRERLASIEPVDDILPRLGAGDADATDLFRIKRFALQTLRLCKALEERRPLEASLAPPSPPRVLRQLLEPFGDPGEPRSRFVLHDSLDPRLGPLREEHRALEQDLAQARQSFRRAIEERFGVRLQRGVVVLPAHSPPAQALLDSGEFEQVASSPLEWTLSPNLQPDLQVREEGFAAGKEALRTLEDQVIQALAVKLSHWNSTLAELQEWIGLLDFRLAKVELATRWGAWPTPGDDFQVQAGWLPAGRPSLEASGGEWVPVDLHLPQGVTLLTGANMGGKSTALALVASLQFLAQLGYPVPAAALTFRWVSRIDILGSDTGSFSSGLSAFAAEMEALAEALQPLGSGGEALLLIDEPGRTTSPQEGKALAAATARHLATTPHTSVIVTHFAALAPELSCHRLRARGLRPEARQGLAEQVAARGWRAALNSAMDYRIVPDEGGVAASDALTVASMFDLPGDLLADARRALESSSDSR